MAFLRQWRSYNEAREFINQIGIETYSEWCDFASSGQLPDDIPVNVAKEYTNIGWRGYGHFLGAVGDESHQSETVGIDTGCLNSSEEPIQILFCMGQIHVTPDKHGSLDSFSTLHPAQRLSVDMVPSIGETWLVDYPAFPLRTNNNTVKKSVVIKDVVSDYDKLGCDACVYVSSRDGEVLKVNDRLEYTTIGNLDTDETIQAFKECGWAMVRKPLDGDFIEKAREAFSERWDREFSELIG